MKTMMKIAVSAFAMIFMVAMAPQAFADGTKTETTKISAKVDCNGCKTKIEHHLSFEKGVKDVVADVETKIVTVEYDPQKTTPAKLAAEITKLGYDGKVMKSDCKGHDHDGEHKCDGHKDGDHKCDGKKDGDHKCNDTKKGEPCCTDKKAEAKAPCKSKCESECKDKSKEEPKK